MTLRYLIGAALLSGASLAFAGPGAHGPNGEHLAAPGSAVIAGSVPTIEAHSDLYELVGKLFDGEFSMMIDHYASNEPLLKATRVEAGLGSIKAVGTFHADQGDYAFTDEALLTALAKPGRHALVITVQAGDNSDVIEGTLVVQAPAPAAAGSSRIWPIAGAALLVVALAGVAWQRRRAGFRFRAGA